MAFDYASMAATATRLLTDFGQTMVVRRLSGGTYNAVTGSVSGDTTTNTNVVGLFVQINAAYAQEFSIVAGDRIAIIDDTVAPLVSDRLVVSSAAYEIVAIASIDPAGTPLAYRVQVRA